MESEAEGAAKGSAGEPIQGNAEKGLRNGGGGGGTIAWKKAAIWRESGQTFGLLPILK